MHIEKLEIFCGETHLSVRLSHCGAFFSVPTSSFSCLCFLHYLTFPLSPSLCVSSLVSPPNTRSFLFLSYTLIINNPIFTAQGKKRPHRYVRHVSSREKLDRQTDRQVGELPTETLAGCHLIRPHTT